MTELPTKAPSLQELICSRTTVQDFSSEPLPTGVLSKGIEAALAAPNHRLTEPWRFVRVGPETRERFARVQARLKDKGRTPSEETLVRAREKLLAPAELIVVVRVVSADSGVGREDYAAIACGIQNLSLSLWAEGVGTKWGTGAVTTDPETYQALGLEPERAEIVGFLSIGFPAGAKAPKKPSRRLGLEQVLSEVP